MIDSDPAISVTLIDGRVVIERTALDVAQLLCGQPIEDALNQIPTLLPICGAAQQIAGIRAVEAARGEDEDAAREERAVRLHREQIEACAWRLAIDWPRLMDVEAAIESLKRVRDADNAAQRNTAAHALVPGLDGVAGWDDLWTWAAEGHCTAARLLDLAGRFDSTARNAERLSGEALSKKVREVLALGGAIDTAVEVGPLAMARHRLLAGSPEATTRHRLAAQLLDYLALLRADGPLDTGLNGWAAPGRCGLGRAMTARGPVFHRVTLSPDGSTARTWQVLAPTDWHFAAQGPVTAATVSEAALPYLVLSFDPCAPWTITALRRSANA